MLTPQNIQSKEFAKAVFGGYDMAAVDDFLEELTADYTGLYKENAVLKAKIKTLVEKVEEYRSTEDAMRMALLTAQKMSDDIIQEASRKRDTLLAETETELENKRKNFSQEYENELRRMDSVKNETLSFVNASKGIIAKYGEFLTRLGNITNEFGAEAEAKREAELEHEPEYSPEPERESEPQENAGDMDDTIRAIDAVVSDALQNGEPEEPEEEEKTVRAESEPEQASDDSVDDSPTRRIEWEEDEITSPRPKFDFKDLKFGSNYFDE